MDNHFNCFLKTICYIALVILSAIVVLSTTGLAWSKDGQDTLIYFLDLFPPENEQVILIIHFLQWFSVINSKLFPGKHCKCYQILVFNNFVMCNTKQWMEGKKGFCFILFLFQNWSRAISHNGNLQKKQIISKNYFISRGWFGVKSANFVFKAVLLK